MKLPGNLPAGVEVVVMQNPPTKIVQHARSTGRAKRRAARGFRQNTRVVPDDESAYMIQGRLYVTAGAFATPKAQLGERAR